MSEFMVYAKIDSCASVEPPTTMIRADKGNSGGTAAKSVVPEPTIEDDKVEMSVTFVGTDAAVTRLIVS